MERRANANVCWISVATIQCNATVKLKTFASFTTPYPVAPIVFALYSLAAMLMLTCTSPKYLLNTNLFHKKTLESNIWRKQFVHFHRLHQLMGKFHVHFCEMPFTQIKLKAVQCNDTSTIVKLFCHFLTSKTYV